MVAWPKLRLTRPKEMTDIGGKAKEKWARPSHEEDLGPVYIHQSIHVMYCASTTEHNNARKSTTSNKSSAPLCCGFDLLRGPLSHCTWHLFSAHRPLAHAITPSSFFSASLLATDKLVCMQAGKQGVLSSEVVFIYYTSGIGNWTRLSFYTAPGKVCLSTTNQTGYYAGRQKCKVNRETLKMMSGLGGGGECREGDRL